jgi:hypothetical protein
MIYIIDKNTNRIIYRKVNGPYLLDDHTFAVEAPTFDLGQYRLWNYRWIPASSSFELALKLAPSRAVAPSRGHPVVPRKLPKT